METDYEVSLSHQGNRMTIRSTSTGEAYLSSAWCGKDKITGGGAGVLMVYSVKRKTVTGKLSACNVVKGMGNVLQIITCVNGNIVTRHSDGMVVTWVGTEKHTEITIPDIGKLVSSPSGHTLVSTSGHLLAIANDTPKLLSKIDFNTTDPVTDLAMSPPPLTESIFYNMEPEKAVTRSPCSMLLSCVTDNSLSIWGIYDSDMSYGIGSRRNYKMEEKAKKHKELVVFKAKEGRRFLKVAASPGGDLVTTIMSVGTKKTFYYLRRYVIRPDGTDGHLMMVEFQTEKQLVSSAAEPTALTTTASHLAYGTKTGTIYVHDAVDLSVVSAIPSCVPHPVTSLSLSPSPRIRLAGTSQGSLFIHTLDTNVQWWTASTIAVFLGIFIMSFLRLYELRIVK